MIGMSGEPGYRAIWREPLQARWEGFDVITAPPPSSGGIGLIQMLEMKQDASGLFAGVGLADDLEIGFAL